MKYFQTDSSPSVLSARSAPLSMLLQRFVLLPWIFLSLVLFSIGARAEQADKDKPLIYSADNLSYDDLKQTTILTGNVVLTKGTILMRGDRAEIRQDPAGYTYATATRTTGLAYIRQKRDGLDEYFEGTSRRIDYDGKNDVSTLTGQATARRLAGLTTPIDEVHGDVIRYDGKTSFYTATANGANGGTSTTSGRVHGMIAPSSPAPAAAAAPTGAVRRPAAATTTVPAGKDPLTPSPSLEKAE
jgi:lipopolysaccharide export system protein LptA